MIKEYLVVGYAAATPYVAFMATGGTLQSNVFMSAAAGATLSALITLRRMLTSDQKRSVGSINAVIAVVSGLSMGMIFSGQMVGMSVFGQTNPFNAVGNAFVLSLIAAQIIEAVADGSVLRFVKSKIPGRTEP